MAANAEAFCERCGARYAQNGADSRRPAVGRVLRGLARQRRNLTETADDFPLRLCLDCRGYACAACWNDDAGYCQTCAPLVAAAAEAGVVQAPLPALPAGNLVDAEPFVWPSLDDLPEAGGRTLSDDEPSVPMAAPWAPAPPTEAQEVTVGNRPSTADEMDEPEGPAAGTTAWVAEVPPMPVQPDIVAPALSLPAPELPAFDEMDLDQLLAAVASFPLGPPSQPTVADSAAPVEESSVAAEASTESAPPSGAQEPAWPAADRTDDATADDARSGDPAVPAGTPDDEPVLPVAIAGTPVAVAGTDVPTDEQAPVGEATAPMPEDEPAAMDADELSLSPPAVEADAPVVPLAEAAAPWPTTDVPAPATEVAPWPPTDEQQAVTLDAAGLELVAGAPAVPSLDAAGGEPDVEAGAASADIGELLAYLRSVMTDAVEEPAVEDPLEPDMATDAAQASVEHAGQAVADEPVEVAEAALEPAADSPAEPLPLALDERLLASIAGHSAGPVEAEQLASLADSESPFKEPAEFQALASAQPAEAAAAEPPAAVSDAPPAAPTTRGPWMTFVETPRRRPPAPTAGAEPSFVAPLAPQAPAAPLTRDCPKCHLTLSARVRFCRRCGAPQPEAVTAG